MHLKSKLLIYPGERFNPVDEDERARFSGYALNRHATEAVNRPKLTPFGKVRVFNCRRHARSGQSWTVTVETVTHLTFSTNL